MADQFSRTRLLFGNDGLERLQGSRVIVFGLGGVGGHVVDALARSGVGAIDIVDNDIIAVSNLNRQIIALHSTLGQYKVDAMESRILDINPACKVTKHRTFFLPETADAFDFTQYDYVVDCIDTVSGKIALVLKAGEAGVPIISSMGAGNKMDPTKMQVSDIYRTSVCPLARVMRNELKKRNVKHLKVVFSTEPAIRPVPSGLDPENVCGRRQTPGSNAFVPSVAGLLMAGEVIRDLTGLGRRM